VLRAFSVLVALLPVALPAAVDAQQFGAARRVEVAKAYPFTFNAGKLLSVDVTPPARIVGVFIRLNNDKDGLKLADRLRVEPKDMAWGIGGRQFYPSLADYVKEHPCEGLR
jgi:hypothetical protein